MFFFFPPGRCCFRASTPHAFRFLFFLTLLRSWVPFPFRSFGGQVAGLVFSGRFFFPLRVVDADQIPFLTVLKALFFSGSVRRSFHLGTKKSPPCKLTGPFFPLFLLGREGPRFPFVRGKKPVCSERCPNSDSAISFSEIGFFLLFLFLSPAAILGVALFFFLAAGASQAFLHRRLPGRPVAGGRAFRGVPRWLAERTFPRRRSTLVLRLQPRTSGSFSLKKWFIPPGEEIPGFFLAIYEPFRRDLQPVFGLLFSPEDITRPGASSPSRSMARTPYRVIFFSVVPRS